MSINNKKLMFLIVVIIIIVVILLSIINLKNINVETNPSNYLKTEGSFSMDLDIFPKVVDKGSVVEYRYHPQLWLPFDVNQYVYLRYKYKKSEYQSEKERLKRIENEYTETKKNTDWLNKESYILYFNCGRISEFAVCDNVKKEIEYVYIQGPEFYYFEKYRNEIVNDKTYDNVKNDFSTMPLGE